MFLWNFCDLCGVQGVLKRGRMGLGLLPYQAARWVTAGMSPRGCLAFGEGAADWQFRLSAADRIGVSANLTVLMDRPVAERSPDDREVFRQFGRYLTEFLLAHRWGRAGWRIDGCEELLARIRPHHGVIVLSAHIGNWELGGLAMGWLGLPVSVVALSHRDAAVRRLFTRQREHAGVEVIPLDAQATRRCLTRLRTGGVVCVLGDREFIGQGVTVTCCGRLFTVPRGPALLSLRTGAPLLPVFCIREGPRHLRFYTEPILSPTALPAVGTSAAKAIRAERSAGPGGGPASAAGMVPPRSTDGPAAVGTPSPAGIVPARSPVTAGQRQTQTLQVMQQYADVLERYLRRFPHQWLMFQSRFGADGGCDVSPRPTAVGRG